MSNQVYLFVYLINLIITTLFIYFFIILFADPEMYTVLVLMLR